MNIRQLAQTISGWSGVATTVINAGIQRILHDDSAESDSGAIEVIKTIATVSSLVALTVLATMPNPGNVRERVQNAFKIVGIDDTNSGPSVDLGLESNLLSTPQAPQIRGSFLKSKKLVATVVVGATTSAVAFACEIISTKNPAVLTLSIATIAAAVISAITKCWGDREIAKAVARIEYANNCPIAIGGDLNNRQESIEEQLPQNLALHDLETAAEMASLNRFIRMKHREVSQPRVAFAASLNSSFSTGGSTDSSPSSSTNPSPVKPRRG